MDSSDLVRRITDEVLRRLDGSRAPGGEPARPAPAAPAPAPAPSGKRALVLLSGGDRRLDEALVQVGRIAERSARVRVVLSPTAQRLVGVPAVRRVAPEAEVLTEAEVEPLLADSDIIYLPNMSLNAASKLANLLPDSLVCILAVYGLLRGLPVVASTDSLLPAALGPEAVPAGGGQALEQLRRRLGDLGVRLLPLERLAGPAGGDGGQGEGQHEHAGGTCAKKNGGECADCGRCAEDNPEEVEALVRSGAARVGATAGTRPGSADINRLIDHTLLKPDATEEQIRQLCAEAREYGFASVCINPAWVSLAAQELAGSEVKVCTVIGFPLGATTPTTKAIEARDAIANGAQEIDMVINVGALKSGDDELVLRDVEAVVAAARDRALVKVILETALLTKEEIVKACLLAKRAGADFVKTSTGFGGGGATVEDIALMRETVGEQMGVKASGGIRDRQTAEAMVAAGATRIGASASVAIATGKSAGAGAY